MVSLMILKEKSNPIPLKNDAVVKKEKTKNNNNNNKLQTFPEDEALPTGCVINMLAKKDVPRFVLCPLLARQIMSSQREFFFLFQTRTTYNFHTSVERKPINHT